MITWTPDLDPNSDVYIWIGVEDDRCYAVVLDTSEGEGNLRLRLHRRGERHWRSLISLDQDDFDERYASDQFEDLGWEEWAMCFVDYLTTCSNPELTSVEAYLLQEQL